MDLKRFLLAFAAMLIAGSAAAQGDLQHFVKEGLTFDFSPGWTVTDESTADAQQLALGRPDSDAQLKIFVHRGKTETPEKFAKAKTSFIDAYVKSVNDTFIGFGAKPETKPTTIQVGAIKADGVQISASLGGEAGGAVICWLPLGDRVVMLTFLGPEKGMKAAMPIWEMVRNSIKVEPPPAKPGTKKP